MTNAGVIDIDYRGEVHLLLVNLGNKRYGGETGDQIAELIIEKMDKRELPEVAPWDDTKPREQGFRTFDTTTHQRAKGKRTKPRMEINEISARAFPQFH